MILQLLRNIKSVSDEKLIAKYKKTGNKDLVAVLFQRYTNLIVAVNSKYLKSKMDIEDATMQVFEILLEDLRKHEVKNFKAWLYSVVKNNSLKYKRKSDSYLLNVDEGDLMLKDSPEENLGEKELLEERLIMMEDKLNELKEEQRKCLKLFYIENRSYKEIEELTGLNSKSVKSHIQNGKRKLKIQLENK